MVDTTILGCYVLIASFVLIYVLLKKSMSNQDDEEDETDSYFSNLSIREKVAQAKQTADDLGDMEQLQDDIAESSECDQIVMHLEWIGRDDRKHEIEIYLDGESRISELLDEVAKIEENELRQALSYQIRNMNHEIRRGKNVRKNRYSETQEIEVKEIAKAVSEMRKDIRY